MHNVQKDWVGAVAIAALGAGVITSFAVSQGQNPFVGLGITLFAAVSAVIVDHFM
jgi:CDP-diglyceride synthetase